jgi:hypothetical protein
MFFASKYVLQANEEAAQETVAEDELNVGLFTSLQSTNQNMFSSSFVTALVFITSDLHFIYSFCLFALHRAS